MSILDYTPKDEPWMADAVCTSTDPDLFFPERGERAKYAAAKAICETCPVRITCLQWALDTNEPYGIYGGTTERDRRNMRGARNAACGTEAGFWRHYRADDTVTCAACKKAHSEHRKARAADKKAS